MLPFILPGWPLGARSRSGRDFSDGVRSGRPLAVCGCGCEKFGVSLGEGSRSRSRSAAYEGIIWDS